MMIFKYFDRIYFLKLVGGCFLTVLILVIIIHQNKEVLETRIFVPVTFLTAILFVYFNRNGFTQDCECMLTSVDIEFRTKGKQQKIEFKNINGYKIQWYQGVTLKLVLHNGKKIVFQANDNFHSSVELGLVTDQLVQRIEDFNQLQQVKIERIKSFFEKKWIFPFLIVFSILIIVMLIYSMVTGKKIAASFFTGLSSLTMLWGGYLTTKNKTYH